MSSNGRIQYTLPVVFWLTTLFGSSVAAFGPGGLTLATVAALFWGYVFAGRNRPLRLGQACVAMVVLLLIGLLLLPSVRMAREASRRAQCVNNLRGILLSLLNYEADHGHFPPPYIADEHGNPMHSWRVLILPYLDHEDLYAKYHWDEPWDGPRNSLLLSEVPYEYQCPSRFNLKGGMTHYAAMVGPDSGWQVSGGVLLSECTAGPSHTALICETPHAIPWTQPVDVTPEAFVTEAKKMAAELRTGGHLIEEGLFVTSGYRMHMGFADGHVESMGLPADPRVLRRLASRTDRYEAAGDMDVIFQRKVKWGKIISAVCFVVMCVLPLIGLRSNTMETAASAPSNSQP